MEVDPRTAEFQQQLPQFIEKLQGVFVLIMEGLREASTVTSHPDSFDPEQNELDPETAMKHWVWLLCEGEILCLSEIVKKLRDQLPGSLSQQLPLSDTAVHDMILSGCDRKAYGLSWDVPKDTAARLEAPVYPALLVWEVDPKLIGSSSQVFSAELRLRMEKARRHRKELRSKLSALEKLVKSIQSNDPVEKILTFREKWRDFEKKDEKLKLIEDERLRKIADREEIIKTRAREEAARKAEREESLRRRLEEDSARRAEKEEQQRRRAEEEVLKRAVREEQFRRRTEEDLMRKADQLMKKVKPKKVPTVEVKSPEKPTKPFPSILSFFKPIAPSPATSPAPVMNIPDTFPSEGVAEFWRRAGAKIRAVRKRERSDWLIYKNINGQREEISSIESLKKSFIPGWGEQPQIESGKPLRQVFVSIHDRACPPVKALMTVYIPTLKATDYFDYDRDTDEEWEELHNAEDLDKEDDDEEDNSDCQSDKDSFVVSDGVFSEADNLSEDEQEFVRRKSVTSTRTSSLVPVIIEYSGENQCSNPNASYSKWAALYSEGKLDMQIYTPDLYFQPIEQVVEQPSAVSAKKVKADQDAAVWQRLKPELALFIHGRSQKLEDLAAEFEAVFSEAKDCGTRKVLREIAKFEKPEGMRRSAWFVGADKIGELGLDTEALTQLALNRPDQAVQPKRTPAKKQSLGPFERIHHE